MDHVINWDLIADPRNWIIIFFTLYLVALIAKMIADASAGAPIKLPSLSS